MPNMAGASFLRPSGWISAGTPIWHISVSSQSPGGCGRDSHGVGVEWGRDGSGDEMGDEDGGWGGAGDRLEMWVWMWMGWGWDGDRMEVIHRRHRSVFGRVGGGWVGLGSF